jgi:hypothetical protein
LIVVLAIVLSYPSISLGQDNTEYIVAAEGITLTIDFGNETILEFNNLTGTSVLNVTQSVLDVNVEWHGTLAYIRGIEGLVGQGATGWEYWVNGEFASIASNLYMLDDSDSILWNYTSPQPQQEYDPTFIPSAILVSLSGMGFIVIVYVQTSRRIN